MPKIDRLPSQVPLSNVAQPQPLHSAFHFPHRAQITFAPPPSTRSTFPGRRSRKAWRGTSQAAAGLGGESNTPYTAGCKPMRAAGRPPAHRHGGGPHLVQQLAERAVRQRGAAGAAPPQGVHVVKGVARVAVHRDVARQQLASHRGVPSGARRAVRAIPNHDPPTPHLGLYRPVIPPFFSPNFFWGATTRKRPGHGSSVRSPEVYTGGGAWGWRGAAGARPLAMA